ncbi:MAG TPA: hypothetical protein VHS53_13070, partial [Mucilaginibacter sp.]|nr:hypothetical protein [Mucilaginibacter sp.]
MKQMTIFLKIKIAAATFVVVSIVIGILLAGVIFQKPPGIRQHAAGLGNTIGLGNTLIDYTSPIQTLDPFAIGMDIAGFGYPDVFANDQVEQQKLKILNIKIMKIAFKYSTPGDPTSKLICNVTGCDTRWTGDQWIESIKAIGAQPIIIVPYSALDAANMVKHFNKDTNNYVQYWIVGNEPDLAGITATTYSKIFNQIDDAMKAIDPTIKIGGGTTAWYDVPFLQTFLQQS